MTGWLEAGAITERAWALVQGLDFSWERLPLCDAGGCRGIRGWEGPPRDRGCLARGRGSEMGVDGARGAGCGSRRGDPGPTGGSGRGVQAAGAGQRPAGLGRRCGAAPAPRGSSRRRPRRAPLPPEGTGRSLMGLRDSPRDPRPSQAAALSSRSRPGCVCV